MTWRANSLCDSLYNAANPALRAAVDRLCRELREAWRAGPARGPARLSALAELGASIDRRFLAGEDHDALADAIAKEIDS